MPTIRSSWLNGAKTRLLPAMATLAAFLLLAACGDSPPTNPSHLTSSAASTSIVAIAQPAATSAPSSTNPEPTISIWTHPPMELPTEPFTPTPPVPESEMTTIVFSLEWLHQNNQWPDSGVIRVTFPSIWMEKAPTVLPGETPVTLHVPSALLLAHDENPDPDWITAVLPYNYFNPPLH